ncbi:MAG TPA: hypothetical protein VE913_12105, partial [Longimicrobium sp.]|nr:hypothetical protein [Longimicrobium sp.]
MKNDRDTAGGGNAIKHDGLATPRHADALSLGKPGEDHGLQQRRVEYGSVRPRDVGTRGFFELTARPPAMLMWNVLRGPEVLRRPPHLRQRDP